MRRILSALLIVPAMLVGSAAPAVAAQLTFTDPAGDGSSGDRLDITESTLRNSDHQVVAETTYVKASRGSLIVFLKARGAPGVIRVVSEHRPNGEDDNYVLDRRGRKQACAGLRVVWDTQADTSRVRMPSRCLNDGDYGALRTSLLTEVDGGSDTDMAPEKGHGNIAWSEWIARG